MRAGSTRWSAARGRAAVLLLGLAAAACTTAHHDRYASLRSEAPLAARSASAPLRDERLFEGAAFLERRELIRQVLERNPTLGAARHAWRAALARYPQVTSLEDPLMGAGLAPRSIGSDDVNDAPKFDLSQRLPFPGKLRLRGEAALDEAEAAPPDYAAARLELATTASLLYDEYVLAVRSQAINDEHIALLDEFQRVATSRYEAGEAAQQDPIQAEVQAAHALHRQIVLATARTLAVERINALLHRAPDRPLPAPPAQVFVPDDAAEPSEHLLAQARAQRPELAASESRVAAQEARVDLAWREFYPDFTLTGSHNRLWQERDLQPFVGVQVNVPLQLGRRRAAVEEAEQRLAQARSRHLAVEDDVQLAVHSGAARLSEARHIVHLYRDRLLPVAHDQVAAVRASFETGRSSFLALIDAQRNLLSVELGHAEPLANLGRRRAELDHALGRVPGLSW